MKGPLQKKKIYVFMNLNIDVWENEGQSVVRRGMGHDKETIELCIVTKAKV